MKRPEGKNKPGMFPESWKPLWALSARGRPKGIRPNADVEGSESSDIVLAVSGEWSGEDKSKPGRPVS